MKHFLAPLAVVSAVLIGNQSHAGTVGGPKYQLSSVAAGGSDSYTAPFYGGQLAQVLLEGDGDTDVDVYVYDQFGNLVASDTDGSDTCLVRWYPRWTGPFLVRVVNRGYVSNRYAIVTN